jgi:HAD superfamily hydrolase (TIGR01662 family)
VDNEPTKNLIFDFDGTIADTLAFTVNSAIEINRKLKLLNDEKIDFERFRSFDFVDFAKELEIPKLKLIYFVFKYQRHLVSKIGEVKTFDDLPEVLKELKNRGVHMGIATSNSKENVRKFLEKNNLNYFNFIYSSLNYFDKSKMLEKAIKKYRMKKEDVIYIGDEVRDIHAAKKAGIKVASVTWGYNFESILSENKPDFIVSRPKDLLKLVC